MVLESQIVDQLLLLSLTFDKKNISSVVFGILFLRIEGRSVENKVTVYYDGLCVACSTEINHYKRSRGSEQINFVDICHPNFNPETHNVDPQLVHKVMHVKRADGSLATEVDAFIEIWRLLPGYWLLVKLASLAPIRFMMNFGYKVFVVLRPYLPRRSSSIYDCSASPYCDATEIKSSKNKQP
jgi:predicted DCC family thiol-disulfide oxidoreductase YuxK